MIARILSLLPTVHCHTKRLPFQWSNWEQHDPMLADLQPNEHGVIRQLSSEAIVRNGLDLTFEDHGFITVRVN